MSSPMPAFLRTAVEGASQQDPISEVYTDERLYVAEYVNDQAVPGFSLARCRVEPLITTQLHSLSVHEWYVVEKGEGLMELDGKKQHVSVGSIVQIPRGITQRITNTGDTDLVFFCVCTPRFTAESYQAHE